jgi:ArsR family transcriptional regulator, arsenate/arsenite/antimonite-responsive transcriptional repressor
MAAPLPSRRPNSSQAGSSQEGSLGRRNNPCRHLLASMTVDTLTDASTAVNTSHVKLVQVISQECCPEVLTAPLGAFEAEEVAAALRVVADPARLRLLSLISTAEGGEACVCNLTAPLGLSQPTVSHHLKVLGDAGLVEREQRGRWAYFRVVPERLELLRGALATPTPSTVG